ncbi:MAG: RNA pseudouridine synthase [Saprospiraceae bacterium]
MSNFKELILHDEKNFTIINKPAGIQTERDRLGNPSIEAMFEDHLLSISRINARPYIVHRLDRPVSGILILAKSKTALLHFQEQILEGIFHKKYLALCEGILSEKEKTLTHYLFKNAKEFRSDIFDTFQENTKESVLKYKVLQENENASIAEVELLTGRYHQIRAQFGHIGHPLWNDYRYGASKINDQSIIGLHAHSIHFINPNTNKSMQFNCKPIGELWNNFPYSDHFNQ